MTLAELAINVSDFMTVSNELAMSMACKDRGAGIGTQKDFSNFTSQKMRPTTAAG
ncbi:hypothetical protein [Pseudooceanicola nanhaiensis]|uniref:hypothetical protein n=1 Tax=Pseudooceanicola nanhaiensis TaxID=375761 RepID=UPI001CD55EB6|nr:hypothetical protein [Pseudooceanicola nanhaiensis]MCA0922095.1 hypothetical protein [Pseudooceanicola nanhaiensis]